MANTFKRAIGGQTLRKKLSGTVFKAGTKQRFTQKSFQKQLQQSTNPLLRRKLGFNKGGTIKKHEALQTAEAFYKEAAEKKDAYSLDSYSLKKAGVKVEDGKISKIGSERMYQTMAQEELKAEAPKGPSKEELAKEAKRKQAITQLNKWRRAREIELENKQKAESKGALDQSRGPEGPGHPATGSEKNRNMRMPTMAHGSMGQMRQGEPQDHASFQPSKQIAAEDDTTNPLIHRMQEEEGMTASNNLDTQTTSPITEDNDTSAPSNPQQGDGAAAHETDADRADPQDTAQVSPEPSSDPENQEKEGE